MSDNDLIRREDAEKARDELVRVLNYINSSGTLDYADYCELFDTIERVFDALKVVPQEMSAREFVIAHHRMCQSKVECVECRICHDDREPRSCAVLMGLNPDDTVAVVEKWAREHPERSEE